MKRLLLGIGGGVAALGLIVLARWRSMTRRTDAESADGESLTQLLRDAEVVVKTRRRDKASVMIAPSVAATIARSICLPSSILKRGAVISDRGSLMPADCPPTATR